MKNFINKYLLLVLSIGLIVACSPDDNVSPDESLTNIFLQDPGVSNLVLTADNLDAHVLGLTWDDRSDYSGTYSVSVANNEALENAINLGTVETNFFSITGNQLNSALLNLGSIPFAQQTLYFSISGGEQTSNPIAVVVRPYSLDSDLTITAPENGTSIVLNGETPGDEALNITWSSVSLSNLNSDKEYTIIIGEAGNFENNNYSLGTVTNANSFSVSHNDLNTKILALGAALDQASEFTIAVNAVTSVYGSEPVLYVSDYVNIWITPFVPDIAELAVPGNHQGWDPGTAPLLRASDVGTSDFQGYAWLDGEYKFIAPNEEGVFAWGNTDWGDDGTFTGVLVVDGEVNCNAPAAGYYQINADTNALTYSISATSWGVIGDATPNGWDADTDLTYNPATKRLEAVITLTNGEIKFRANDDWALNLGDNNDDNYLDEGGNNIVVTAGTYLVALDLSDPRRYTYTLTPQ